MHTFSSWRTYTYTLACTQHTYKFNHKLPAIKFSVLWHASKQKQPNKWGRKKSARTNTQTHQNKQLNNIFNVVLCIFKLQALLFLTTIQCYAMWSDVMWFDLIRYRDPECTGYVDCEYSFIHSCFHTLTQTHTHISKFVLYLQFERIVNRFRFFIVVVVAVVVVVIAR